LLELIAELNADDGVDGILVQLPLPDAIDQDAVVAAIDPGKDVDGLTAGSAGLLAQGRPGLVACTPQGVMELLRHAGVEEEVAEAITPVPGGVGPMTIAMLLSNTLRAATARAAAAATASA